MLHRDGTPLYYAAIIVYFPCLLKSIVCHYSSVFAEWMKQDELAIFICAGMSEKFTEWAVKAGEKFFVSLFSFVYEVFIYIMRAA